MSIYGISVGAKKEEAAMYKKLRDFHRIPTKIFANCGVSSSAEEEKRSFLCQTEDLSLRGACLLSSRDIGVGQRLSVALNLPKCPEPVQVDADVVWTNRRTKPCPGLNHKMRLGVRFREIGSHELEELGKHLDTEGEKHFFSLESLGGYYCQSCCASMGAWVPPASLPCGNKKHPSCPWLEEKTS